MITAWCLSVAFFAPWLVGVPFCWLFTGCRRMRPTDWLWTPFVGLFVIITVLLNLYLLADLPLRRTTTWFWLGIAGAWIILLSFRNGRSSLRTIPWQAISLMAIVFLGQAVGILVQGVEAYRGNIRTDQVSYFFLAQYLMDMPFSTPWPAVGQHPWLAIPMSLKDDRLGQSILHGFLAVTAGRDAIDLFFTTSILGPTLLVPVVLMMGPWVSLHQNRSRLLALACGLAPGVTHLVSGCFLSQTLCLPMFWGVFAAICSKHQRRRYSLVVLGGLFIGLYPESLPLFLWSMGFLLLSAAILRQMTWTRAVSLFGIFVAGAVLNLAALHALPTIWGRSQEIGHQVGGGIVWAHAGLLPWINDQSVAEYLAGVGIPFHLLFVCFCAAMMIAGWIALANSILHEGKRDRRLPLFIATTSLLILLLSLRILQPSNVYAGYKLILMLIPLGIMSIFVAADRLREFGRRSSSAITRLFKWAPLFVLVLLMNSSLEEQLSYSKKWTNVAQGGRQWNHPDTTAAVQFLQQHASGDIVMMLGNGDDSNLLATRLIYQLRNRNWWFVSPDNLWYLHMPQYPTPQFSEWGDVPDGSLVVTRKNVGTRKDAEVLFQAGEIEVLRVNNLREFLNHK